MTDITTDLAALLQTVQRPGDFYASGTIELLPPALAVDGLGPIALPLLPMQAEQLVALAEQAPYGRGQHTLVDPTVRRTWQIGPDKARVEGRHWPRTLEAILSRVSVGLGISDPIEAEFYKLLLYEKGSFFVSHRDTEKTPGMFATLVVVLPSQCSGGELIIRHQDREARLDLRADDPAEASFAAFYADCPHEVLPVTDGCRLVLVYNVLRLARGRAPEPPDHTAEQRRAAALLNDWSESLAALDDDAPQKLVYLLEHAYTPAELAFTALKGADAAAAGVLAAAARQSNCDLHLALLTREEAGPAEYSGYGRSRRHGADDDIDEFEVVEISDCSTTLSEWRAPDGPVPGLAEIPVEEEEISPPEAFEALKPDEAHFSEATGNEGASFERTYRRAALVLWPHDLTLAVLCQAGLKVTLPYLADLARRWLEDDTDSTAPLWQQAHELAGHMIDQWPTSYAYHRQPEGPSDAARMLETLTQLEDTARIEAFLSRVTGAGAYAKSDNAAIMRALTLLPRAAAIGMIERIIVATGTPNCIACVDLLRRAVTASSDQAADLRDAAVTLMRLLPGDPAHPSPDTSWYPRPRADAASVADLEAALSIIDEALAVQTAEYFLAWPNPYDPDTVLIPAVKSLLKSARQRPSFARLHAACLEHLGARIAEPLAPPADWRRPHVVGCTCADCEELSGFLAAPERKTWIFKAAQQRRSHVESTIKNAQCDVDTTTDRHGSPHGLVCIKNQASYQRRAAQRAKDNRDLAFLSG